MRRWCAWWRAAGWSDRHKTRRPWPEGLEGRALLASITEYPIPSPAVGSVTRTLGQITTGPDGNIWFTDVLHKTIDRVDPAGTITEFSIPGGSSTLGITPG
jgi:streptogramin lyase